MTAESGRGSPVQGTTLAPFCQEVFAKIFSKRFFTKGLTAGQKYGTM